MLHSKSRRPSSDAGFSLLETLIALAILATVTGVAAAALRAPSPGLQLDSAVSELRLEASTTRRRAVTTLARASMVLTDCTGRDVVVWFFPDGTASGSEVCVTQSGLTRKLRISALSGRLIPGDTQ